MSKGGNIIPEEIHLIQIEVIESSIIDSKEQIKEEFNLNVGHKVMHNLKEQKFKISLNIELTPKNKNLNCQAKFVFDFQFRVENLKNFYELKEEDRPVFSGLLIATLLGLSFSTSRGIIYEKLSNTNMKGILLPIIDSNNLLSKK